MEKGYLEEFARFFEQPTRPALRDLLRKHVGELDHLDFKESWVEDLARHVLAMGNSGGGAVIFGVRQGTDGSFESCGLSDLRDKAVVAKSLRKFVPESLRHTVHDFVFPDSEYPAIRGLKFQVLLVEDNPEHIPFLCLADGPKEVEGTVYVRDGTESKRASYRQLQDLINRRLATGHSTQRELTLTDHLADIRMLYQQIDKTRTRWMRDKPSYLEELGIAAVIGGVLGERRIEEQNPEYPKEAYEAFIRRMIETKGLVIETFLRRGG
jgi:hypothetical protein